MSDTKRSEISWQEMAALPLTLLEPKMQNRVIIDRLFQEIGEAPVVVAEASAMSICVSMACEGLAATVVPAIIPQLLIAKTK